MSIFPVFLRSLLVTLVFVLLGQDALAQRSAATIADSLAISCFEDFSGLAAVGVASSPEYPSIKSGLYSHWRSLGIELFEITEDSKVSEALDRRVQYRIEKAAIGYKSKSRKEFIRKVDLVLYQSTLASDFKVLSNNRCERSSSDTILRSFERNEPSELAIDIERGGKGRYIKPVILTATLGAISYLFFTVRSSE